MSLVRLGQFASIPLTAADLKARLIARLGEFAATRAQLAQMRARATPQQAPELDSLIAEQAELQAELPDVQLAVEAMQRGELNLALGGQVVTFIVRFEDYMRRFGLARGRLGLGPSPIQWGKILGVGAGVFLGFSILRSWGRRR